MPKRQGNPNQPACEALNTLQNPKSFSSFQPSSPNPEPRSFSEVPRRELAKGPNIQSKSQVKANPTPRPMARKQQKLLGFGPRWQAACFFSSGFGAWGLGDGPSASSPFFGDPVLRSPSYHIRQLLHYSVCVGFLAMKGPGSCGFQIRANASENQIQSRQGFPKIKDPFVGTVSLGNSLINASWVCGGVALFFQPSSFRDAKP